MAAGTSANQLPPDCDIISMRGCESEGFALCLRSGERCVRVREGLWCPTATAVMRTQKLLCLSAVRRAAFEMEGIYGLKCSRPQAKLLLCEDMAVKTASEVVWRTLNVPLVGTLFVWVWLWLLLYVICVTDVSLHHDQFRGVRAKQKFLVGQLRKEGMPC